MRGFIFLILLALTLTGCGAKYYATKSKRALEKAIEKDPKIKLSVLDTVYAERVVTLKGEDGKDSLIFVFDTVIVDCGEVDFSTLKSSRDYRQDKKTERTEKRQERKAEAVKEKEETKRVKATIRGDTKKTRMKNRSNWWNWIWVLAGVGIGWFFRLARDRLRKH